MTLSTQRQSIFDHEHYLKHIEARGHFIRRMVTELQRAARLETALDAGCGVGFFSTLLKDLGLGVEAFDGRESNVEEARKRYPEISFIRGDIEDKSILEFGEHDLVLCFGLLYHLENPLMALRHLRALTKKVLLLETMCLPVAEPTALLRIEPDRDDQSLTDLAFYASEGCIVKMLYHAGFKNVYRAAQLPDHDDFRETETHIRRRTVLLAAFEPVKIDGLVVIPEPHESKNPWRKTRPAFRKYDTISRVRLARNTKSPLNSCGDGSQVWRFRFDYLLARGGFRGKIMSVVRSSPEILSLRSWHLSRGFYSRE